MKIIKRIAEQAYCFTELQFDDIVAYEKEYPDFIRAYTKMQKTIADIKEEEPPFDSKSSFQEIRDKEIEEHNIEAAKKNDKYLPKPRIKCKICNQVDGDGYCAEHSTSGVAYVEDNK